MQMADLEAKMKLDDDDDDDALDEPTEEDLLKAGLVRRLPQDSSLVWPTFADDTSADIEFAQDVLEEIAAYGYCLISHPDDDDDFVHQAMDEAEDLEYTGTCNPDFSATYLGKNNVTEFAMLPPDNPDGHPDRMSEALLFCDRRITRLAMWLQIEASQYLENRLEGRLNAMVRRQGRPVPAKSKKSVTPHDEHADAKQALGHLNFLDRRVLCIMYIFTDQSARLTLYPAGSTIDDPRYINVYEGSRIVIFEPGLWEYTYAPRGRSIALQTWLLSEPFIPTPGKPHNKNVTVPRQLQGEQVRVECCSARLPGYSSETQGSLWPASLFAYGSDCALKVPTSRFDLDHYFANSKQDALLLDKSYARHGSFCSELGLQEFDSHFFHMGEAETGFVSPAHRLLMEVGYELLATMWGSDRSEVRGKSIGVMVGDSGVDWDEVCTSAQFADPGEYHLAGRTAAVGAARLLHFLDMRGPVSVVDSACSSGLVAVHLAHSGLQQAAKNTSKRRSTAHMDMALPMSVNCLLAPRKFVQYSAATMLSLKGRCFTMDSSCDGFLRGEAAGAMLMSLTAKEEQRWSCSAGSFVNQDGRSASLTAPHGPSQSALVRSSLEEAGFQPGEVGAMECHGTGTALGDPIEWSALCKVVSRDRTFPGIGGSSKTSCGHSEASAGVVGLLKCIHMILSAVHYSSQHLRALNANVEMGHAISMQFATELVDVGETVCVAGVSSFGSGGTNARGDHWGKAMRGHRECEDVWNRWDTLNSRAVYVYDRAFRYGRPGPQPADRMFIRGSWSAWDEMKLMKKDADGDYTITVAIGRNSEESFQLCVNADPKLTFHPAVPRADASQQMTGPTGTGKDKYWLLKKEENPDTAAVFRIWFRWKFDWALGEIAQVGWDEVDMEEEENTKIDIDCRTSEHRYYLVIKPRIGPNREMFRVGGNVLAYEAKVCLRDGQGEMFQILRDNDPKQAIHPRKHLARKTNVSVMGPDHLGEGKYWVLDGYPGEEVVIRLEMAADVLSVSLSTGDGLKVWTNRLRLLDG